MANKRLVRQLGMMYKQIQNTTPQVYAALALALARKYGWDGEQIRELFEESQAIWNECVEREIDMIKMCDDETGIEVISGTNER